MGLLKSITNFVPECHYTLKYIVWEESLVFRRNALLLFYLVGFFLRLNLMDHFYGFLFLSFLFSLNYKSYYPPAVLVASLGSSCWGLLFTVFYPALKMKIK